MRGDASAPLLIRRHCGVGGHAAGARRKINLTPPLKPTSPFPPKHLCDPLTSLPGATAAVSGALAKQWPRPVARRPSGRRLHDAQASGSSRAARERSGQAPPSRRRPPAPARPLGALARQAGFVGPGLHRNGCGEAAKPLGPACALRPPARRPARGDFDSNPRCLSSRHFAQAPDRAHPRLSGSKCSSRPGTVSGWGGRRERRLIAPCTGSRRRPKLHCQPMLTVCASPAPFTQVPPGPAARRRSGRLVPGRGARHCEASRHAGAVFAGCSLGAGRRLAPPADLWRAGGGGRRARGAGCCWVQRLELGLNGLHGPALRPSLCISHRHSGARD